MNNGITRTVSMGMRAIAALACATTLACAAVLWPPVPASAQSTLPSLTINACDDKAFPSVTCVVTALDRNGVPAQDLTASTLDVLEPAGGVAAKLVTQTVNIGVATSLLFLVDLSASLKGPTEQTVKDTMDRTLDDMAQDPNRLNDMVALIALTTDQVDVGDNTNAPPISPTHEVNFSIDKVLPRNTLKPLTASRPTPLYDGIRKALALTARQPIGRRAIIVMSDGFDSKSSNFTADSDIAQAQRESIPLYTAKFGKNVDNAKLQRLALDTGGAVITPGDAAAISDAIRNIQDTLKTQYVVSFRSNAPSASPPEITFRWKTPSGVVEQKTALNKLPPPPAIIGFKINGEPGDLNTTPLKGQVTIEPQFQAGPPPLQVEYELSGSVALKKQAPFSFSFNAGGLPPDVQLVVRVYASPVNFNTQSFALNLAPAPPIEQTPVTQTAIAKPAVATVLLSSNPTLLIAIIVAAAGLLVLLVLIGILLARRRQAQPVYSMQDVNPVPMTSVGIEPLAPADAPPPITTSAATQAFQTQVMPNADIGKTQVWRVGIARLEFTGGERIGDKVMIGMPGAEGTLIGRETGDAAGNIRLTSSYVSRRHAVVKLEGNQMYVTDLKSSSGTRVNGVKLEPNTPTPIKVGDKIEFANVSAVVIEA